MTVMMIEASSPLAAMQPPSFVNRCGYIPESRASMAMLSRSNPFGPGSFNFKDLSMKRPQVDYFNMPPPVRGSSPTASLAADLSQNMHIDKSSPQVLTPRRALFSTNLFATHHVHVTTPPVPSSSPAPTNDGMDISPLPHKPAFGFVLPVALQSPTPDTTPAEPMAQSDMTPRASSSPSVLDLPLQQPHDRRKIGNLRPSLSRAKGHTTTCVPQKPSPEAQLPPFQFGNGSTSATSLPLAEIFECSSPVQDRSSPRVAAPFMQFPRLAKPISNIPSFARNASPVAAHARKLSKDAQPAARPRKLFRRSLSMFEHPDEVMRQEKESAQPSLPTIADLEAPHVPQLPHFYSDNETCDLPRISKDTMIEILDGKFDSIYGQRLVIDCRFEYEYEGGHIDGAFNFNDKEQLASQLFGTAPPQNTLLIFHCEYSAHRAPLMAKFIRNKDRSVNAENYPNLTYPEAYVLDGGYSAFYKDHSIRCFPQNYVEMDSMEHARACEIGMGKVKHQQRAKLTRAQTFAFGQHSPSVDSSPTAMGRSRYDDDMDMDMGLEFTPVPARPAFSALQAGRCQRMFSY